MLNNPPTTPEKQECENSAKPSKGYNKGICPFCNNTRENCVSKQGLELHKAIEEYLEKFYTNNGSH